MWPLAACDDLPVLERDRCGNTVIERGEDCDGAGAGENLCNEACRLECTAGGACPAGWGCGADGLCRQPTGVFSPLGNPVAVSAERLDLADVDGDGRADVLATRGGSVTVAYAGAAGLSSDTTDIALPIADTDLEVPSAGDVDGDSRADLVLRFGGSLGVLRGQQNRTLAPGAFSRRLAVPVAEGDVLVPMYLQQGGFLSGSLGAQILSIGEAGISVVHVSDDAAAPGGPLVTWPQKKIVYLGNSHGIDYAFEGESEIHAYYPIGFDPVTLEEGWNFDDASPLFQQKVTLPGGVRPAGDVSPLQVSWKADTYTGFSEYALFVPGEKDGVASLHVGFQQGGGLCSFPGNAAPAFGEPDYTLREIAWTGLSAAGERPLAVRDIDGDGTPDLATPRGLYLSTCTGEPFSVESCPLDIPLTPPLAPISAAYFLAESPDIGDAWTGVHFYGNQALVTTEKPGFIVYRSLGDQDSVKRFRVPTRHPVSHVAFGDFNGDGSPDVVLTQLSERASPGDPARESVHVSFGDAFGLPTAPVDLGDVGEVTQIFAARLFPALSGKIAIVPQADGVDDIVVRAKTGGATLTYVFAGSTDGQIQSPLDLASACQGSLAPSGVPRFSTTASLSGEGAREVLVVYRREAAGGGWEYDLWSAQPASGDSETVCGSLVGPAPLPDPGGTALSMTPIDLDGDGKDEVVVFAEGSSKLFTARLADGAWSIDTIDLGAPHAGVAVIPVFTAGEGDRQDVVLWSEDGVTVLRNDGSGTLDAGRSEAVSIAGVTCPGAGEGGAAGPITGVAAAFLHPDAGRELLVLTEAGAFVVELGEGAAGGLEAPRCDLLIGGGTALTSGDVDGDGVEDLVIARPSGIQVLAGIPVVR